MPQEFDLDSIGELLTTTPERTTKSKKPQDIRDKEHWFKLDHIVMGTCSQGDDCIGLLLYDKGPGRVTSVVNNVEMCRLCFLDGLAYSNE